MSSRSGHVKTKTIQLVFAALSAKHEVIKSMKKDCLDPHQNNASK